jgi:hypothetical protein
LRSNEYGSIATMLEASGLQPATEYRYRLFAQNEAGQRALNETGGAEVPEGKFVTAKALEPEAVSGAASSVGTTTATISGTANPEGAPAAYRFELGVYDGAATKFGVVFSGDAGGGIMPVEEALNLSGLQPGTTYAFRIDVSSAYGTRYGAPVTFTTLGLPAIIQLPAVSEPLPVPPISFPKERCKRGFKLDNHGKCLRARHAKRHVSRRRHRHKKKKKGRK